MRKTGHLKLPRKEDESIPQKQKEGQYIPISKPKTAPHKTTFVKKCLFSAPLSIIRKQGKHSYSRLPGKPARISLVRNKEGNHIFYTTLLDALGNETTFFIPQKVIFVAMLIRILEEPFVRGGSMQTEIKKMLHMSTHVGEERTREALELFKAINSLCTEKWRERRKV